jgi:hypothetical protein
VSIIGIYESAKDYAEQMRIIAKPTKFERESFA